MLCILAMSEYFSAWMHCKRAGLHSIFFKFLKACLLYRYCSFNALGKMERACRKVYVGWSQVCIAIDLRKHEQHNLSRGYLSILVIILHFDLARYLIPTWKSDSTPYLWTGLPLFANRTRRGVKANSVVDLPVLPKRDCCDIDYSDTLHITYPRTTNT